MFDTPLEATLKAENARLRAENEYLRRHVEAPGRTFSQMIVEEELPMARALPPDIRLPCVAGVEGSIQASGGWAVRAYQERIQGDRLEVKYYTDGYIKKHIDDDTFLNHILPKMHEQFIRQLSTILSRR